MSKKNGCEPNCVIDIGAAKGTWTSLVMQYFPESQFILVEPLKEQIDHIPSNIIKNPSVKIIEGVAGENEGIISFSISDDLDGSGVYGTGDNQRKVAVFPIDHVVNYAND